MPALDNERHEMFAHFVARGNIPVTAYVAAGYIRDPDAAEVMSRHPTIAARIDELRPLYHEKYRKRVSPQTILKQRRDEENALLGEPEA
ncbi:terminase small subunit [Ruegeria phage RpAliso]|nr:terminase small subunit [Ruegeria phage RpAliso]